MSRPSQNRSQESAEDIRHFYDSVYYAKDSKHGVASRSHHARLARRLGVGVHDRVLDVACGRGDWLHVCAHRGAAVAGIDISDAAIARCRETLPSGEFKVQPAESLPFPDGTFSIVSCLGAVEHFLDPLAALREMLRVAKADARILLLVPNADFLTRRLGLYGGTLQMEAKEDVRSIAQWTELFNSAGLEVTSMWRDLHVLSKEWILCGRWHSIPFRFIQAVALPLWPLRWQYQIYFLCKRRGYRNPGKSPL